MEIYTGERAAGGMPVLALDIRDLGLLRRIDRVAVGRGWFPPQGAVSLLGPHDAVVHELGYEPFPDEHPLLQLHALGKPLALLGSGQRLDEIHPALHGPNVVYINTDHGDADRQVDAWLGLLEPEAPAELRGVIEALHRKVHLLVTENDDLLGLLNDYADQVERHKGELSEAQIEVRTLRAVLAQVDGYNQTLLLELSKRKVDKHTASLTVRAMMKAVDLAMTGAVTIGATYAGTVAAQPPATLERIDAARLEVVAQCDRTIQVIGGPFANLGDEMIEAIHTD